MRRIGMMVLSAVVLIVAVLATVIVVWIGSPRGPQLEQVVHRKEPRLTTMAPQNVLVVTARGDPNTVGKKAFGLLMSTYFRLKDVPKLGPGVAPRARWPVEADLPADQWVGQYAMPVPDSVADLSGPAGKDGLKVELQTWDYGEVAEVLHVGSYHEEKPTIERLKAFIEQSGYEIAGLHEDRKRPTGSRTSATPSGCGPTCSFRRASTARRSTRFCSSLTAGSTGTSTPTTRMSCAS